MDVLKVLFPKSLNYSIRRSYRFYYTIDKSTYELLPISGGIFLIFLALFFVTFFVTFLDNLNERLFFLLDPVLMRCTNRLYLGHTDTFFH